jgi:hypothetical protein
MDSRVVLAAVVLTCLASGVCAYLQFRHRRWLFVTGYACLAASSLVRIVAPGNVPAEIARFALNITFAICVVLEIMRKPREKQPDSSLS